MSRADRGWRAALIVALIFSPNALHAEKEPDRTLAAGALDPQPIAVDLYEDLQIALTGVYVGLASSRVPLADGAGDGVFSAAQVNRLDRTVIGNHSQRADSASDALLATNLALPFAASAIDHLLVSRRAGALGRWGRDALVLAKTFAVSMTLCNVVKYAVRRPRPYLYDAQTTDSERLASDARLSFFSGHTALAFSMATTYSYLFTVHHPESPLRVPIWIGTHGVAAATAMLRVEAGKHFWSDVLMGAAVGSAVGLLVPYLHRIDVAGKIFGESRLFSELRVTPAVYNGGWGVNAMAFF